MNTMEDLRREVASRLRNALHGRQIDLMKTSVELPHMLGITPIGKEHDPRNEEMTIIDPKHPFWNDYESTVDTERKAIDEVTDAIRSLRKDGTFKKTYPHGEEADIVYVEVDTLDPDANEMETECQECGASVDADVSLEPMGDSYSFYVAVDCSSCGFSGAYKRPLIRT